jgi:hypothetical protein
MKLLRLLIVTAVALATIMTIVTSAAKSTLPLSVFSARAIYVDNQSGFAELYNTAYLELARWGRFENAEGAAKADLIIVLTGSSSVRQVPESDGPPKYDPNRTSTRAADSPEMAPVGFTRVTLVEARTGAVLWSGLVRTDGPKVKGRLLDGLREAFDQAEKARNKR